MFFTKAEYTYYNLRRVSQTSCLSLLHTYLHDFQFDLNYFLITNYNMTDLLEEKVVQKIQLWNDDLSKIQSLFSEFSKSVTDYDRESDSDERKNKSEKITELHDKIVEELDILGEYVGEKYDALKDELQYKYDDLFEKYETAQGNGYFNHGERDGKKEREEIKKLFKLSKENLSNTNLNKLSVIILKIK